MQNLSKDLKIRLKEAMAKRGIKVPALSDQTGIPKDRVYAWYRDNTSPKTEDAIILENWLNEEKPSNNEDNRLHNDIPKHSGYVPANDLIEVLKEQNEFLRRNFEVSLNSIAEGQQQAGNQIKALSWFSALSANSGDEKKAEEAMLKINNRIAFYEGVTGEEDISHKEDKKNTSGKRKQA